MRLRALLASVVVASVVVAAIAPIVLVAGPASAHDALVGSDPAAGSSVSGDLDRVTLTLSEPPLSGLQTGIVISVTEGGGAERTVGDVRIEGTTIAKDVDLTAAGAYRVQWRSVSVDGHPISGEYGFTSTGATAETPTAGPTTAASEPTATATATADAVTGTTDEIAATQAAAPVGGHQHHTVLLLLVALAVVAFAAVVGIRALRTRRTAVPADSAPADSAPADSAPADDSADGTDTAEHGTDR